MEVALGLKLLLPLLACLPAWNAAASCKFVIDAVTNVQNELGK